MMCSNSQIPLGLSFPEEQLSTGVGQSPDEGGIASQATTEENRESGRMSPYLMISKTGDVAKVTEFESPGLLYAKPTSKNNNK